MRVCNHSLRADTSTVTGCLCAAARLRNPVPLYDAPRSVILARALYAICSLASCAQPCTSCAQPCTSCARSPVFCRESFMTLALYICLSTYYLFQTYLFKFICRARTVSWGLCSRVRLLIVPLSKDAKRVRECWYGCAPAHEQFCLLERE